MKKGKKYCNWGGNIPYLIGVNAMANFIAQKKEDADYDDYYQYANTLENPMNYPVALNQEQRKGMADGGNIGMGLLNVSLGKRSRDLTLVSPTQSRMPTMPNYEEQGSIPDQIERFKQGIAAVETPGFKNPYTAQNPNSSASGKYQFIKGTLKAVYNNFGYNAMFQNFDAFHAAYKATPKLQEDVMTKYSKDLLNTYKNPMAAAVAFFAGGAKAKAYLEGKLDTKVSPTAGTKVPNATYAAYLNKFSKASGFEHGGIVDVDPSQIEKLRELGIDFEIIQDED
jgi:hypothetical protein